MPFKCNPECTCFEPRYVDDNSLVNMNTTAEKLPDHLLIDYVNTLRGLSVVNCYPSGKANTRKVGQTAYQSYVDARAVLIARVHSLRFEADAG